MPPLTTLQHAPLRKARGILRKSGREAAVAYLSHEVKSVADVSDEMADGIASDAIDGDEEILMAILQLVEELTGGAAPEESAMMGEPPVEEPPMEDKGMPSPGGDEGVEPLPEEMPPMLGDTVPGDQPSTVSTEAGMHDEDNRSGRHDAPGDHISPEEPEDPDKQLPFQKAQPDGIDRPASNRDPAHQDSSLQHKPSTKPNTTVPGPPVSLGAPVVGQLERAPKQAEEGGPRPPPRTTPSYPAPAGSDTKPANKWVERLAKGNIPKPRTLEAKNREQLVSRQATPKEIEVNAKAVKWQNRLAKSISQTEALPAEPSPHDSGRAMKLEPYTPPEDRAPTQPHYMPPPTRPIRSPSIIPPSADDPTYETVAPMDTELNHVPFSLTARDRSQNVGGPLGDALPGPMTPPEGIMGEVVEERLYPRTRAPATMRPTPEPSYAARSGREGASPFERFQHANKWQNRLMKAGQAEDPAGETPSKGQSPPFDSARRAWERRQAKMPQGPMPGMPTPKPDVAPAEVPMEPKPTVNVEDFAAPAQAERIEDLPAFAQGKIASKPAGEMPATPPKTMKPRGRPPKFGHQPSDDATLHLQSRPREVRTGANRKPPTMDTPSRQDIARAIPDTANLQALTGAIEQGDLDAVPQLVESGAVPRGVALQSLLENYKATREPDVANLIQALGGTVPTLDSRAPVLRTHDLPPNMRVLPKEQLEGLMQQARGKMQELMRIPASRRPNTGYSLASLRNLTRLIEQKLYGSQMTERRNPLRQGGLQQRWSRPEGTREAIEQQQATTPGDPAKASFWEQGMDPAGRAAAERELESREEAVPPPPPGAYTLEQALREAQESGKGSTKHNRGLWKAQLGESLAAGESQMSKHKFGSLGVREPPSPSERVKKSLHHTQRALVKRLFELNELRKAAHAVEE